jgi:hypothetical protein
MADLNMTVALQPLVDLVSALPTILQALIPVVLVIVVLVAVQAVGNMITGLFGKIGGALHFGRR